MSNDITDRELKFYQLYEELVSAMTDFDDLDPARVRVKISELCAHLRIAKAVTRLYRNEREERE